MDILIKKEVLEEYAINTKDLLLCISNHQVCMFTDGDETETLYKIKWKIENDTIIIYKEQEENI